jgi:LmbE family N-acetylglucosaminyl deacetylase
MSRISTLGVLIAAAVLLFAPQPSWAQLEPLAQDHGATGLGLALRHLPVTGRVLYVTAHPDDENNPVLVKLNRGLGLSTALLTLTRGDGGQNEIGPELFQALGILRTEELLNLHRFDGAQQFFSRAYEFGYSFSVEETFDKWGKEEILGDIVRVIRSYRPDVILTLPLEAEGGGQHHQASARLAQEAFRAAADPTRFPEQLREGLRPWQASKIYQGGVGGGNDKGETPSTSRVSTGAYDPLLGMTSFQYGMLSRTAHKCQGTGQVVPLGIEAVEPTFAATEAVYRLVDSEPAVSAGEADLFDGIDTSLGALARFAYVKEKRVADALATIEAAARKAGESLDVRAPQKTTAAIATGLRAVRDLSAYVKSSALSEDAKSELLVRLGWKERDFVNALSLAQALYIEAIADDGDVVPGQPFGVVARVWNRGAEVVVLDDVALVVPEGWTAAREAPAPATLAPGTAAEVKFAVTVSPAARYSQPYWKRNPKVDRWDIEVPKDFPLPWSPPDVQLSVSYKAAGTPATLSRPAMIRYTGPWVGGEKQKVVNVVPALSVALSPDLAVVPTLARNAQREFRVKVLSNAKQPVAASVRLEVPSGFKVEPGSAPVELRFEGEEATIRFTVTAPAQRKPGTHEVKAVVTATEKDPAEKDSAKKEYAEGYQVIAYDHIQERHLFHPAVAQLEVLDVKVDPTAKIGYVAGAGDEVPQAIEQLGLPVTFLTADDLAYGDLSRYTTIVTGIRAYQTRNDLKASNNRLLEYAKAGGNVVVQYNKFEFNQLGNARAEISPYAPYPAVVTSDRVTVEDAPMTILDPKDEVFTTPNAIGNADFAGWVQERGLYFFGAKDPKYKELLASRDPWPKNPGEKKGILTEAPLGKGTWTYVGLGLWRQLPAGTPGAYRLMANLLSRPRGK